MQAKPAQSGILAAILIASVFMVAVPTAVAHTCDTYDESGCDPNGCTKGEDHDHRHMKHWYEPSEDETCESHKEPEEPPQKEGCRYNGIEFPPLICNILNGTVLLDSFRTFAKTQSNEETWLELSRDEEGNS